MHCGVLSSIGCAEKTYGESAFLALLRTNVYTTHYTGDRSQYRPELPYGHVAARSKGSRESGVAMLTTAATSTISEETKENERLLPTVLLPRL